MDEIVEQARLQESAPGWKTRTTASDAVMLDDSLSMSPWERILANDDVVNFGDSLRAAMEKRNAESR